MYPAIALVCLVFLWGVAQSVPNPCTVDPVDNITFTDSSITNCTQFTYRLSNAILGFNFPNCKFPSLVVDLNGTSGSSITFYQPCEFGSLTIMNTDAVSTGSSVFLIASPNSPTHFTTVNFGAGLTSLTFDGQFKSNGSLTGNITGTLRYQNVVFTNINNLFESKLTISGRLEVVNSTINANCLLVDTNTCNSGILVQDSNISTSSNCTFDSGVLSNPFREVSIGLTNADNCDTQQIILNNSRFIAPSRCYFNRHNYRTYGFGDLTLANSVVQCGHKTRFTTSRLGNVLIDGSTVITANSGSVQQTFGIADSTGSGVLTIRGSTLQSPSGSGPIEFFVTNQPSNSVVNTAVSGLGEVYAGPRR